MKVKIRWVYQLTKHLGNVRIVTLEDKLTSKADYTEELWQSDCEYVKQQIVRSHFVKKVLLIGGESVGKSTLTINLANYYNTNYLEEVGRDLSELSGTDLYMLSDDFTRILLEHKAKEIRLIGQSNKVLFEDTDCLITRFYMGFLKDEKLTDNGRLADAIAALNSYDLILFLEPDVTWVQDGDRSEVIAADRIKYSEQIKEFYRAHGFHFQTISGDYVSRFEQAVEAVDRWIS